MGLYKFLIIRLQLLHGWLRYNRLRLVAEGHALIPTPPGVLTSPLTKTRKTLSVYAIYIIKTSVCWKRWIVYVVRYPCQPSASRDYPECTSAGVNAHFTENVSAVHCLRRITFRSSTFPKENLPQPRRVQQLSKTVVDLQRL